MFKIEIETDNDAFRENPDKEIAEILLNVAEQVTRPRRLIGYAEGVCYDTNGNRVGSWSLELVQPDDDDKEAA